MASSLRDQLLRLSADERLTLIETLWDSLSDDDPALELSEEQRRDLERRLAEADADPDGGASWDQVRERIRDRTK